MTVGYTNAYGFGRILLRIDRGVTLCLGQVYIIWSVLLVDSA